MAENMKALLTGKKGSQMMNKIVIVLAGVLVSQLSFGYAVRANVEAERAELERKESERPENRAFDIEARDRTEIRTLLPGLRGTGADSRILSDVLGKEKALSWTTPAGKAETVTIYRALSELQVSLDNLIDRGSKPGADQLSDADLAAAKAFKARLMPNKSTLLRLMSKSLAHQGNSKYTLMEINMIKAGFMESDLSAANRVMDAVQAIEDSYKRDTDFPADVVPKAIESAYRKNGESAAEAEATEKALEDGCAV